MVAQVREMMGSFVSATLAWGEVKVEQYMGVAVTGSRVKDGKEQVCVVAEFAQRAVAWVDKDKFEDVNERKEIFETIGKKMSRGLRMSARRSRSTLVLL